MRLFKIEFQNAIATKGGGLRQPRQESTFPSKRESGFTSATDVDADTLDENANPISVNASDQQTSSEFRHGHPIAGNAGSF